MPGQSLEHMAAQREIWERITPEVQAALVDLAAEDPSNLTPELQSTVRELSAEDGGQDAC